MNLSSQVKVVDECSLVLPITQNYNVWEEIILKHLFSMFPVQVWIHLSVRGWRSWSLHLRVALTTPPCSPFYRRTLCSTAWTTPSPAWYVNTNASSDTLSAFVLMSIFVFLKSSLILRYPSEICCPPNRVALQTLLMTFEFLKAMVSFLFFFPSIIQ